MGHWLQLVLFHTIFSLSTQDCSWNTCNEWAEDKDWITAHLIPHTHDDLGWIKTVDQYYYGSRPDLVPVGVQYIYNTVIDELLKNPSRRFSFAETGFLWRWFTSNGDFERHQLQKLVKTGQIELIGGGWVQNDEATSHYVDIIDQMTLGLKKLVQLFGECGKPQVGWQIDPFGHSREMANLYSQMGYTSLYFARIHYLEKEERLRNKTLEFVWNASDDLKTQIFTGAFFQDNYGPPEGFCWDALCGDDPIMDNPNLEEYNVQEKVDAFLAHVKKQASFQRSNHVMLLMGSDFQYTNANSWYTNLDKLIKYVNANETSKVRVIYSTPSCYTKAVIKSQPRLTSKNDDFFPYASSNHSYWTGYFTSRPTFKGMIREASSMLQLAKQLDMIADLGPEDESDIEILKEASALNQHHDAVTGTAKENVTRDYEKQLARGMDEVKFVMNDFLKKVSPDSLFSDVVLCPLINETICTPIRGAASFAVIVFNSNGRYYNGSVVVPFYSKGASVQNANGDVINAQLVKSFQAMSLQDSDRAPYELTVPVSVPPLGYTTIFINASNIEQAIRFDNPKLIRGPQIDNTTIENEYLLLEFDVDGYLSHVFDKTTNVTHSLRQEFFYYQGTDKNDSQPSGAYVFRPASQSPQAIPGPIRLQAVQTQVVNEMRQYINPWISQIIRLPFGKAYIEFDWIVGPIPKENGTDVRISKEVVTRYTSDIKSQNVFYTDSNGRQSMRRVYAEASSFEYADTEPTAGNYYPITSFAYIKDDQNQLTVLTDRAQGMTSRADGLVEIMVHRRCFYDDHWGVEEALDEPGKYGQGLVALGRHTIFFAPADKAAAKMRPLAVEKFHAPVLAFSTSKKVEKFKYNRKLEYSGLTRELPEFAHLLTLERWHKKNGLIRFEHIFQNYEDAKNSVPQDIDVQGLFTNFEVTTSNELLLGANQNKTTTWGRKKDLKALTLIPSQIRTFEIEVERKKF